MESAETLERVSLKGTAPEKKRTKRARAAAAGLLALSLVLTACASTGTGSAQTPSSPKSSPWPAAAESIHCQAITPWTNVGGASNGRTDIWYDEIIDRLGLSRSADWDRIYGGREATVTCSEPVQPHTFIPKIKGDKTGGPCMPLTNDSNLDFLTQPTTKAVFLCETSPNS